MKGQVKRESQTRNGSFYTKWLLCRHDIMDQRNILRELLCVSWKWQTYWRIIKLVYFFSIKLVQFKKGRVFMTSEIVVSINALKTQNSPECPKRFFWKQRFLWCLPLINHFEKYTRLPPLFFIVDLINASLLVCSVRDMRSVVRQEAGKLDH